MSDRDEIQSELISSMEGYERIWTVKAGGVRKTTNQSITVRKSRSCAHK